MHDNLNNLLTEISGSKILDLDLLNDEIMDRSRDDEIDYKMDHNIAIQGRKIA